MGVAELCGTGFGVGFGPCPDGGSDEGIGNDGGGGTELIPTR